VVVDGYAVLDGLGFVLFAGDFEVEVGECFLFVEHWEV